MVIGKLTPRPAESARWSEGVFRIDTRKRRGLAGPARAAIRLEDGGLAEGWHVPPTNKQGQDCVSRIKRRAGGGSELRANTGDIVNSHRFIHKGHRVHRSQ